MELIDFIKSRGFSLCPDPNEENDGHMSVQQKKQFTKQLHPNIRKIAEIGLNAGHSADHFFKRCPQLEQFVSFDINLYPVTQSAVAYFCQKYPKQFQFIEGDSLVKVPEFSKQFPGVKFDLVYVDGCHDFRWAMGDIVNGKSLAHKNTLLWVDDVHPDFANPVGQAIRFLETVGLIHIDDHFSSDDPIYGLRNWVQARYIIE